MSVDKGVNTRIPASHRMAVCLTAALLLAYGCRMPQPRAATAATPNFGPPMQDVRTEAIVQQMEMDYNAATNSQPTFQGYVEAQQKKQAEAAKQAKEKEAAQKPAPPPEDPKP